MEKPEIRSRILSLLAPDLERAGLSAEHVDDSLDILDAGVVDSFGFIDFCLKLEEAFGVPIDIDELDDAALSSIGGIVAVIEKRHTEKSG